MNKVVNKKLYISKVAIIIAVMASLASCYYFFQKTEQHSSYEIKDFDKTRDAEFIRNSFKGEDLYWLVENPEFDIEYMMDNKAPNRNHPEFVGKLNIKVLFENGKPAGFTTYYKTKFYEGKIQFIYISPAFRNKGYAGKLTKYDVDQLFKQDAKIVKLATRVNNAPAIKVYERVGFKEYSRDNKFIDFVIAKPA